MLGRYIARPLLSVLMPALSSRRHLWQRLIGELRRQAAAIPWRVEILTEEDDGQRPSGAKRNALLSRARGHYVVQVDDDDWVSDEYLAALCEVIYCSRPDVVGLRAWRTGGNADRIHEFALNHGDKQQLGWIANPAGIQVRLMAFQANHLCAWRRELATACRFPDHLGYNDDLFWYQPLIASGLAKRGEVIERVLYYYRYDPQGSANQSAESRARTRRWAAGGVEHFWHAGRICRAEVGRDDNRDADPIVVIDPEGRRHLVRRDECRQICTVNMR